MCVRNLVNSINRKIEIIKQFRTIEVSRKVHHKYFNEKSKKFVFKSKTLISEDEDTETEPSDDELETETETNGKLIKN